MNLQNKVAVVTGGARDLGRAISVRLAKEGAKVALNYYVASEDEKNAQETLSIINDFGGTAIAVKGDMTRTADVENLFREVQKAFGEKIDILVNVVGGLVGRRTIEEMDESWYQFLMDVNMKSCFLAIKSAAAVMGRGAAIVNFSSLAARDGGGNGASMYATAKGAVSVFTRAMAKELGPRGIRVNALCPGTISTSFHDRFNTPENRERMKKIYPLQREGTGNDVADLVVFLASDESSYITGANIDINGGIFFS